VTNTVRLVDGATIVWLRPAAPAHTDQVFCASHEITFPAAQVVDQPLAEDDGILDVTARHGGATFRATLVIRDAATTRHQAADQLRAILAPSKRPTLIVQRDGWSGERQAVVRGDTWACITDRTAGVILHATIQAAIPGGVLEDTATQTAVIRPSATSATGRTYPKTYPWSYTPANAGSVATLTSAGNVATAPMLRLYGACTEPVILNVTTGQQIELDDLTLVDGQYLDIDLDARTVLLNGDPSLSYYDRINFATSTWWKLQPGANIINVAVATSDASCELDVSWTDRWIGG
jgi:hypothetical protein